MTDLPQTESASFRLDPSPADALDVRPLDALVALVTFAASLAVLAYSLSRRRTVPALPAAASSPCSSCRPATWRSAPGRTGDLTRAVRAADRDGGDRADRRDRLRRHGAVAVVAAAVAVAAAAMVRLHFRRGGRGRVAHLYDELVAGRLPTDPVAKVPRFTPILQGASVEDQQRVLGVIGRRYHADFRPVLRRALRNRNGFIRAQAAAVASRLSADEKSRLWSDAPSPASGRIRRRRRRA